MSKPYTIIQCSNYFEYMNFKDSFKDVNFYMKYFYMKYIDSTYTVKTYIMFEEYPKATIFKHAPTATITSVSFRNGRAIYTKLKD